MYELSLIINHPFFNRAYHLLGKRIVAVKVRTIQMSISFRTLSNIK